MRFGISRPEQTHDPPFKVTSRNQDTMAARAAPQPDVRTEAENDPIRPAARMSLLEAQQVIQLECHRHRRVISRRARRCVKGRSIDHRDRDYLPRSASIAVTRAALIRSRGNCDDDCEREAKQWQTGCTDAQRDAKDNHGNDDSDLF